MNPDTYLEVPCERDGNVIHVPSVTVEGRGLEDVLNLQQRLNDTQNILAAFMLRDMLVECANCGESCLRAYESTLCQECVTWPAVVYEDVLDAEKIG